MLSSKRPSDKGGTLDLKVIWIIFTLISACVANGPATTSIPTAPPPSPHRGAARQMYGSGYTRQPGTNPSAHGPGQRPLKPSISSPPPPQLSPKLRPYMPPMVPYHLVPVPVPIHDFDKFSDGYPILIPQMMPDSTIPSSRSGAHTRTSSRGMYGGRLENFGMVRKPVGFTRPHFAQDLGFVKGRGFKSVLPDSGFMRHRGAPSHTTEIRTEEDVIQPEEEKVVKDKQYDHPCFENCSRGQYQCILSCQCISDAYRCDGDVDCENSEDELECGEIDGSRKCEVSEKYIQCPKTRRCISREWLCDGDDDCGDFTDETHCGFAINCTVDQFECSNGLCIPNTWVCDNDNDCKDFSDESNCTKTGCTEDEFMCSDGLCISLSWKCDKEPDCGDNSDESECDVEPVSCNIGEFYCNGKCIKAEFKCDGDNDCDDWSDEDDCPKTTGSCTSGEFKCNSGKCIPERWRCDKQQDCEGNEDEVNCEESQIRTCSPDEFTCNNGACILNTWVCDGVSDCNHNEDEAKCEIVCDETKFACTGGALNDTSTEFCINKKHVCDGRRDCPKGEDEKDCPIKKECDKGSNCSQLCILTADGKNGCTCLPGYNLAADGITCQDVNECLYQIDPVCSQTCNNTIGSFKCGCMTGYILRPDLRSCKALGAPPTLLFANRVDIRQVSLSNQKYTALLKGLHNAIALDYHYEKKLIFWSDVSIDVIKRSFINGSGVTDIIKSGLESPGGVALDWIHDLLFWTDSGTRRIEVSNLDGKERAIIIANELDKPRAIAVHPGEAFIFWTDWGPTPKIERADMDGTNRKSIITESVFWPNGLTLDYTLNRIYWADAKHNVIETALYDGSDRRKVISKGLPHPFALTIFEDAIYWTDWHTKSISTANKVTGAGLKTIHSKLHFPMDIHSYHPQRQPAFENHCGAKNGGCAHMCLPNSRSFACVCPMGQKLKPDGKTCLKPEKLLIFARKKDLRLKHLDDNSMHQHEMVIPLDGVKSAVALAWDSKTDSIFWTDVERDTINRAHWNGSKQEVLVHSNILSPAGLAYDWITDKIYWTDAGTSHIEVANSDGTMRGLLIWENLDKPRDIILDPIGGYMYWSDFGEKPKIERAAMDGSMRSAIVNYNLTWPNGLAIDHTSGKLYWADGGTKSIEYANLDGTKRRVLIGPDLPHPFGLDVFESNIYWTDWQTSNIETADKTTGLNRTVLRPGISELMDVRVFHRKRKFIKTACNNQNGGCSHLCLLKPNGHTCACPIGIKLESDGKTCTNGPINSLILAHRFCIRQISLDVPYIVDVVLPFSQLKNVVSVDVDRKTGEVYWTDNAESVIEKSSPDGKNIHTIMSHEIFMVDAIAVDSTGRKIYWTDGKRNSIEVAELNGENRKVLIWSNLDTPRALTLHYHHGLIFWSDWGENAKIEVAQMDGRDRKSLITDKLEWPNGLAIDRPTERLYWNDGKLKTIESSDLDGKNRKVILTDVPHPYGLVVVGNHMYWTDWQTKGLHRAEKITGADRTVIRRDLEGLMDVHSVQTDNIAENACGTNNGGCSHLCLRNANSYTCECPTGISILKGDNKTCEYQPENYLLFATRSGLARISLDTIELWEVTLPIKDINHAIDVDFHWKKQLIVYTDVKRHKIVSINMKNFTDTKDVAVNISAPNGVAIDWIANNIYWTDTETAVIEASKLDGLYRKTIVKENLTEPRSIAVFPRKGYLYWTEWGKEPKIERAYLDGSSRKTIINSDLGFPNGLMVDYKAKRLYWTDARWDRIENSDLHGQNRIQLIHSNHDDLNTHPFGLALFGDLIYWTDWYQKSIIRADKATGKNTATVRDSLDGAMGIISVSESRQLGWNPCAVDNGGCSHYCFHKLLNYTCGCPDNHEKTCKTEPEQWMSMKNVQVDYDDFDDEEEKTYYDPNNAEFDDMTPKHREAGLSKYFYIMALIPMLCITLLSIVIFVIALLYRKSKKKYLYATGRSVMTFSNPNYYTSGGEPTTAANTVDKKPFLWKRLKYDKSQERVYEEKTGNSSPEVTSLIPTVLTPSSSNCEAVTPELDRSPSVTPLHHSESVQPVI